ncbi:MAG: hypothetical protein IH612_07315 [Desulfofustis sp.]|nr:hypothetical protein [Desulfofustis sp.]
MSGKLQDRRNWTRSLTVVVAVALVAVITGYLLEGTAVGTDRLYLRNTAGAVLFDHGAHGQYADSCATCHHPLYGAAPTATCADCHDDNRAADDVSHSELKELHARDCSLCHQQQVEDDQAVSCRQCHPAVQQSETNTSACTACHNDDYVPEMLSHDEYLEIDDHSCLGCHAPRSLADSYHTNCSDCHLDAAPEKFMNSDGTVRCGSCHLR